MKKLLLSLILLFSITIMIGQTVPRQMVVMEITTSVLCTYCPGAALGADDLLSHGDFVAVMEDHNLGQGSDPFANSYSEARCSYYNYTGNPTAVFDGIIKVVGGNHTQSMYSTYAPKYSQRISVPSNISMSMDVANNGLAYTVTIHMTKVGTLTTDPKAVLFAVTQSHIAYNWEGQSILNYVNRLMVPDQNGTTVDFTSGDEQSVTLNFNMDASWPLGDCEFIAFVQDLTSKEVLQGMKRGVVDLTADFTANNTAIPKDGSVSFTSTVSGGYINTPQTYTWIIPGASPDTSTMPSFTTTYPNCGPHDVTLLVDRGGQIDSVAKVKYIQVGPVVNVNITPADTTCVSQPITLDATTQGATYLWAPGGETTPSITVDGNVVGTGSHLYAVTVDTPDGCSQYIISRIFFDPCTGIPQKNADLSIVLYPNPNHGSFTLEMNSLTPQNIKVEITNSLGMTVYSENGVTFSGKILKPITLNNISSGVYFLTTTDNNGKKNIQKFLVN
jgi:hypothetical protein